jgi:TonB family protein
MSPAIRGVAALIAIVATLTFSTRTVRSQGSLNAARDLYAAAAYDEALSAFNALAAGGETVTDSSTVALYRALCLYALGRNGEGDRAVEAMVAAHPMYRPPFEDLSPRMRTTVTETRKRLLPGILQQEYADAKSAFERQDHATALVGFKQVIAGLGDPDLATLATRSPLSDLGTLAAGFRDLAEKALTPPPPPKAAVVLPGPVAAAAAPRIYSAADTDVAPPVVVRQLIPTYTRPVTQRKTAVVELLINERGAVESAAMISPLDPMYDRAVVTSAKNWQYEPAKVDGKPVKYQKRVQITLIPTPSTR